MGSSKPTAGMYELEITRRAKRDFRRLSGEQQQRIWKAIQALAVHPRPAGCKRLVSDDPLYRVRVGNYRILYTVEDAPAYIVVVYYVGPRQSVYRNL